jgi:hypothetical protein
MIDYAKIDTTINIGGVAIHQPVTAFTDIIISTLCFCFFLKLKKIGSVNKSDVSWKWFYLFLSLASLFGGCSHGFFAIHDGVGYKSFWFPMQWFNIFSAFCAQQGTLHSILKDSPNKETWKWANLIQVVLFSIAVLVFSNFLVVVLDSAIALIPVMVIHFKNKSKQKGNEMVGWGIVILFFTAIINGTKVSINEYFTYLDIAHVFIIGSLSVMFIGIKQKAISGK